MTGHARILVVDDEPDLRLLLEDYLGTHGYAVRAVDSGGGLDRALRAEPADVIILDVNMPGEDGFTILARLRAAGSRAGIVMLTAAGAPEQRVAGLGAGADDYLPKPFEPRELLARIRSVLRRLGPPEPPPRVTHTATFGPCRLDLDARRLTDGSGGEVALTAMEFDLLATFARHPRQVLSRERLSELAHNRTPEPEDRSIDIRITRLRKKIEPDPGQPTVIRTLRGEGYLYDPDAGGG